MQTKAVIRAAIKVKESSSGLEYRSGDHDPADWRSKRVKILSRRLLLRLQTQRSQQQASDLKYHVGTMIEIPRAALTADEIAKEADFFCFGTNDLTQMTFGFSRDDAGKFLGAYYDAKILRERSVRKTGSDWCWQADGDGYQTWQNRLIRICILVSAASTAEIRLP